eukprot:COSAG06_NODE_47036_length_342_cov_0.962963_1_plen_56_part_10
MWPIDPYGLCRTTAVAAAAAAAAAAIVVSVAHCIVHILLGPPAGPQSVLHTAPKPA